MARERGPAVTVAMAALALLAMPRVAHAQFLPVAEEAPPGITIGGAGVARVAAPDRLDDRSIQRAIDAAQPRAVTRAVRDARRRGAAIAAAVGVELGQLAKVELQDSFPQFRQPPRRCRGPRRREPPRCRVPDFTAAAATVTFSIVGGARGAADGVEVEAYGAATAAVEPEHPRRNRSIRQALMAARVAVTPGAAAAARRAVKRAARSAGLTLGGLISIAEEQGPYPYLYDVALGSFGPGQFCGVVGRRIRVRRCGFPRTFSLRLQATYEAR